MKAITDDEVLALAAVFQALRTVSRIAKHGHIDRSLGVPCLFGLLRPYEDSVAELYQGAHNLAPGLRTLTDQFVQPTDMQLTRHMVAILHLEKKLRGNRKMLETVREGVNRATHQGEYFDDLAHENVVANLAEVYRQTVSTLRPQILVHGDPTALQDPKNAAWIRTLLLCAVRAVSLWRSHGGNRWRLMLLRKQYVERAEIMTAASEH